jgi:hypothetical protein
MPITFAALASEARYRYAGTLGTTRRTVLRDRHILANVVSVIESVEFRAHEAAYADPTAPDYDINLEAIQLQQLEMALYYGKDDFIGGVFTWFRERGINC